MSKRKLILKILFVVAVIIPHCVQADVVSDFEVDDEGWTVVGDPTSSTPNYFANGGWSGSGYINAVDTASGDIWYWNAPTKFLGDHSSGTTLSFARRSRGTGSGVGASDVVLNGAGISLHLNVGGADPGASWSATSIGLHTANWRVDSLSGSAATATQIDDVLSDLTQLRIRGEFILGPDEGDLDEVRINSNSAVPEPGSMAALILGGIGFLSRRRRRLPT